tara:strand:- start:232 stop:618 length:387 start_codon:yes stop_codon:yes gene_type:complete
MHRTIYDTTTGEILSCRRIPDHMLDNNINRRPNTAYLNTYVQDISVKKVDLSNLSIVDKVVDYDWNEYMRLHRNGRLKATDWTQVPDSPLSNSKKAEWATYRQQLRDLPSTLGNITSREGIIWPTEPS